MGTTNEPGKFDCHAKAEADEPLFTLLARDPLASALVSIWGYLRLGDPASAQHIMEGICYTLAGKYVKAPDTSKAEEALQCAHDMREWYRQHRAPSIARSD
jgi:hypothetical protein